MARPAPFELIAGNVALDFANTLDNRYSPAGEIELLQSYSDLLCFSAQSRILAPAQARRLHRSAFGGASGPPNRASASGKSGAAAAALRSAIRLREAMERIFRAIARAHAQDSARADARNYGRRHSRRHRPAARDLAIFNAYVRVAMAHRRIAPASASASAPNTVASNGASFVWQWTEKGSDLSAPLWPVALAAAELLASADLALVRECRSATCRWLFLDGSKNHSRRWCDMKTCGNRVKARRYYRKRRAFQLM
jgi:predicted RNA-binding Zn ribbon-like protein